jgi:hypothetical protein
MSEWCKYNFDLLDHERVSGADLTHIPKTWREVTREAMHALYWRAVVMLQKQRSDTGLVSRHALWGPLEARRGIAEELVKVGMLEERATFYYPRNYLEKNRSGSAIRAGEERVRENSRSYYTRKSQRILIDESAPKPVCDSLSLSLSGSGSDPDARATAPPPTATPASVTRIRTVAPEPDAVATPPPTDVPVDADIIGRCAMAGYPRPTAADVQAMLARARARGARSHDWAGELVLWMSRAKQFAATRAGPADTGPDPAEHRRRVDAAQREADREARRREREAVPPPANLAVLLEGIG